MTQTPGPLKVLVHVPKTGGTTLNRLLQAWNPNGIVHCESIIRDPEELSRKLPGLAWISGHVSLERMRKALSGQTDRELKFYSVMREPTRQIASHYNWLIEIYHRGEVFYQNHSPLVQRISGEIRAADNKDPEEIIRFLRKYKRLFQNQQSRMILPDPTAKIDKQMIARAIGEYEFICTDNDFGEIARRLTCDGVHHIEKHNSSKYHFDAELFRTPPMQDFLRKFNRNDAVLYRVVQSRAA